MARSKTAEAYASNYKSSRRWEANRKRKLLKTMKEQPNNKQIPLALESMVYRRKTPNTREWSASWIAVAKLFKQFTGKFDRNIMSSNPKTSAEAIHTSRTNYDYVKKVFYPDKDFFTLGNRIYKGSK